ncbi:MAG: PilZ domain-containing protein [Paracoccaceae bacterium]
MHNNTPDPAPDQPADRRAFRRFSCRLPTKFGDGTAMWNCEVINISANGARICVKHMSLNASSNQSWHIVLPVVGDVPFSVRWRIAPDYGIAFDVDKDRTAQLLNWLQTAKFDETS